MPLLPLHEIRVLLELNKNPERFHTVPEIANAIGISVGLVRSALKGSRKSESSTSHATDSRGLLKHGYVEEDGETYRIKLPPLHRSGSSGETVEDEEEQAGR